MKHQVCQTQTRWLFVTAITGLLLTVRIAQGDEIKGADGTSSPSSANDAMPLQLTLEAMEADDRWVMTVTNGGTRPVQLSADARLLRIEVVGAPRAEQSIKSVKDTKPKLQIRGKLPMCQMPAGMRPTLATPERMLLLRPGERYQETLHPVALCGTSKAAAELGPGAIVYPLLGWPEPRKKTQRHPAPNIATTGPFVAEPLRGVTDVGPWPSVAGVPLLLPSPRPVVPAVPGGNKDEASAAVASPSPVAPFTVTSAPRKDAVSGREANLTVTVRNVGKRAALVHLRPDNVTFAVREILHLDTKPMFCGDPFVRRGAAREFFSTLGAGQSRPVTLLLGEHCPHTLFDRPGVYALTPRLTLPQSGESYHLHALTTDVDAVAPTLVRIQRGPQPYHSRPPAALPPVAATDDVK